MLPKSYTPVATSMKDWIRKYLCLSRSYWSTWLNTVIFYLSRFHCNMKEKYMIKSQFLLQNIIIFSLYKLPKWKHPVDTFSWFSIPQPGLRMSAWATNTEILRCCVHRTYLQRKTLYLSIFLPRKNKIHTSVPLSYLTLGCYLTAGLLFDLNQNR